MEDVFHLVNNNTQYFYGCGCPNDWKVWRKNPNASTVVIFCLGGGGGGGGGETIAFGNSKNGGGGGGSAAYTVATFPAYLLPDELFINVASGGTDGPSAGAGGAGTLSYVSINPSKLPQDCVCVSGTVGAQGAAGSSQLPGGAGGTIVTSAMAYFLKMSTYYAVSGNTGGAGVNGGAGTTVTALQSTITSPGAGGGGSGSGTAGLLGGSVLGQGLCNYVILGGSAYTDANGGDGFDGVYNMKPFCAFGGSGGGGTGINTGGKGGNGSFGSGGGGGGGGSPAGAGGKGGNGLVIITQI
jgi:hypothetical protein